MILTSAPKDASKAARGIAPKLNGTPDRKHLQTNMLQMYMSDSPLLAMAEEEKIALLKACDQYIRAQAPNAGKRFDYGWYEEILIIATDGTVASDIRPLFA